MNETGTGVQSKPSAERRELRRKAYELFLAGETAYGIHKALGVSVQTASNWVKRFTERGEAGVAERKRGAASSPSAKLSPADRSALLVAMVKASSLMPDGRPVLYFAGRVKPFFAQMTGQDLPARSIRRWLVRLGLTNVYPPATAFVSPDLPGEETFWLELASVAPPDVPLPPDLPLYRITAVNRFAEALFCLFDGTPAPRTLQGFLEAMCAANKHRLRLRYGLSLDSLADDRSIRGFVSSCGGQVELLRTF